MNNVIIENKKTDYMIVYSKDSTSAERNAASILQTYLYKASKVCIPIHSDKCEKRKKEIIIGKARGIENSPKLKTLSEEAFIIYCDNDGNIIFNSNSDRGIIYSVYRFLEDYIGYRCFASDCEKYDEVSEIKLDKEIIYDFDFEYRDVYFTDAFTTKFASSNMLNSNMADLSEKYGGKVKWFNFHHSFSDLVNPNIYFDTHPEYFSFIDGKRRKEHTELCLSNPEVLDLCVKKVLEWKKNNPECIIFSVSQDEWMGHFIKMACECDNCKKIDLENNSQSGSIITFVNKVQREVNKIYPDVLIHTFAYQYSRHCPTKVKPNDNVIVRLCNIECSWDKPIKDSYELDKTSESASFYNDLVNWGRITNRLYIWDYATDFHNYLLPFPNIRSMVKNILMYKENHVKGLLMQGNFSHGGKGYLDELKSYIASRYMRYSDLDLNTEIKEFCDNYYGLYSDAVIKYLNLFEDNVYNKELWLYDDSDSKLFSDKIVSEAKKILDSANLIKEDKEKSDRFDLVKLTYEYMYLTRLDLDYPNREKLIDDFFDKVYYHGITELFERTELDFSKEVMKKSRYAKDRSNWHSLYYIMK